MKIGIDASRANRRFRTGTEWYSYYLIRHLAALDKENQYTLYTSKRLSDDLKGLPPNFQERYLAWPFGRLWTQIRLSLEMRHLNDDLLFVPAHTIPIIHPRTVTTIHDLGFIRHPELYSTFDRGYQNWALKHALKQAHKIIAVSQFTKNELITLSGVKPSKIDVVYHGCDRASFTPIPQATADKAAQAIGLRPRQFLLYVGRIEAKKNTLRLVKAFSLLRQQPGFENWQLAIVGRPGFEYKKVADYIRNQNLQGAIKLPGWLPQSFLPSIMSSAGAFVFPSIYEGFGLPILEAMACGQLIFASDLPPIREIAGNTVVYINPHNPEEMAQTIGQSLGNRSRLYQEKQPQWEAILAKFTWDRCASQTLSILKAACYN